MEVSDRIVLRIDAEGDFNAALEQWREYIAGETLAVQINGPAFTASFHTETPDGLKISLVRAS